MTAQKPRQEQLCPQLTKAEVREELLTDRYNSQSLPKKKIKVLQVSTMEHSGRAIPGKATASPLNAPQLTLWPH